MCVCDMECDAWIYTSIQTRVYTSIPTCNRNAVSIAARNYAWMHTYTRDGNAMHGYTHMRIYKHTHIRQECDFDCCQKLLKESLGYWDLTTASLYTTTGPHRINNLSNVNSQTVTCGPVMCTYSRRRPVGCNEAALTHTTGPATFRDEGGSLGAALLRGPTVGGY
jgi:hypothetical protein